MEVLSYQIAKQIWPLGTVVVLMKEDLILNVDNQNGVTSNDARLLLKMVVQGNVVTKEYVGNVSMPPGKSPVIPGNTLSVAEKSRRRLHRRQRMFRPRMRTRSTSRLTTG